MDQSDADATTLSEGKDVFVRTGKRRFFVTPDKVMGIAPATARYDDSLCILFHASVPFVLRRLARQEEGQPPRYKVIGPAYALGYMSGHAILRLKPSQLRAAVKVIDIY